MTNCRTAVMVVLKGAELNHPSAPARHVSLIALTCVSSCLGSTTFSDFQHLTVKRALLWLLFGVMCHSITEARVCLLFFVLSPHFVLKVLQVLVVLHIVNDLHLLPSPSPSPRQWCVYNDRAMTDIFANMLHGFSECFWNFSLN